LIWIKSAIAFYTERCKKIIMNSTTIRKIAVTLIIALLSLTAFSQLQLNTPRVESKLYLGAGKKQPLLVGLGGSEGGNAWASEHWKKTRDTFIDKGYAFLALGYFGATGTPDTLNKIALEDIHNAIREACKNPNINKNKIAIIGGSRGADLALLIASYYPDINCVVGIVPSHVTFPGHTNHFTTSSWTYQNKELPFVPVNFEAVPFLMKRDLRGAFEAMLQNQEAEEKALIKVENIRGAVLLLSATKDEIAPTTPMCEKMITRMETLNFRYAHEHVAIEGGHTAPLKHMDLAVAFLDKHFPVR
jgi:pimeloyl-ACP methyl ester carboxylesterase